jgi:glycosyltransferase involved in cell wall biosynthesis
VKIFLVNSLYPPDVVGGAEKSVMLLAESFVGAGHEVVIACLTKEHRQSVAMQNGVKVYRLPLKNIYWPFDAKSHPLLARIAWHLIDIYNPQMSRAVARIVAAEKPDIVQTHNLTGFSVSVWHAVSRLNVPLTHALHDYSLICPKTTMHKGGKNCGKPCVSCKFFSRRNRALSSLLIGVVGVSGYILRRHQSEGYFPNIIADSIVHNPVESSYSVSDAERVDHGEELVFGFIGQIGPSKGLDHFLTVLSECGKKNWRFIVAGRGQEKYLDYLAKKFGSRVRFIGYAAHKDFFPQIDILVMPSLWHEPFGRSALDGLVWRKPVIAANRGGLPDIVVHQKTGWLYEPENADELPALLCGLLSGKTAPLPITDDVREEVLDKFRTDNIAARFLGHLQRIIYMNS